LTWSVPVSKGKANTIPLLWARSYLRDLEYGALLDGGSRHTNRRSKALKEKLLETAMRYGLVSSETSLVAIEMRSDSERSTQWAEYRAVPVQLTKAWHGIAGQSLPTIGASGVLHDDGRAAATLTPREEQFLRKRFGIGEKSTRSMRGAYKAKFERHGLPIDGIISDVELIIALLHTQTAAGWFDCLPLVARAVQHTPNELKALSAQIENVAEEIRQSVLATAIALILFRTKAGDVRGMWRRAGLKAKAWMNKNAKDARLNGRPLEVVLREFFITK
jgi:hypothetical protein